MRRAKMESEKEVAVKNDGGDMRALAVSYLDMMGMSKLARKDKEMFINLAAACGLNPFKREIYCIPYGDKASVVTGYETYIKRADRTGRMDGWQVEAAGDAKNGSLSATLTIWRKDWSHPFTHQVFWREVRGNSPLWQRSPVFMTKKVAISQGFRLCFPDELGGMPYTADEADATEIVRDITPPKEAGAAEAASAAPVGKPYAGDTPEQAALREFVWKRMNEFPPAAKEIISAALNGETDAKDALARAKAYLAKKGVAA